MSKIHYFQRYSTQENAVTNNTLLLIARIYNYSVFQASKLLTDLLDESIEIGLEINQQKRGGNSVPDGAIVQRSLKILIEAKTDSGIREDQLINHCNEFKNEDLKILLLLTKNHITQEKEILIKQQIAALEKGIIFKNITYEDICEKISNLFKDHESDLLELTDDYIEYCNEEKLIDESKNLLRIIPCGQSYELNKKYGIYFHPSYRGYRDHKFIGIYKNKVVSLVYEIDAIIDVELKDGKLNKTYIKGHNNSDYDSKIIEMIHEAKIVCGYNIESEHRFFCGKEVFETNFIKTSSGGIQGARFVNLKAVLNSFDGTKDIALKLNQKTWE